MRQNLHIRSTAWLPQDYGENLKSFGSLEYQKQHLYNKDYDDLNLRY